MTLVVKINGTPVQIIEGSFKMTETVNDKKSCQFTVYDPTGASIFQHGQKVQVYDNALSGITFNGFINKPTATNLWPNPPQEWDITCVNHFYVPTKKVSKRRHKGQKAAPIVAKQIEEYLEPDGVSGTFGLDFLELQSEWQSGQHSNTTSTTNASTGNVGAGDLELVTAGNSVLFQESSYSDFSAGTNNGAFLPLTGGVTLNPWSALKFTATQNISGISNAYTYMKIWAGSHVVASGDNLYFDTWIADSCPAKCASLECTFSDGTSMQANASTGGTDAQGVTIAASNDLSGLAVNTWYTRQFDLTGGGAWTGKTLASISLVFGGSTQGNYTAYYRNILLVNGVTYTYIFGQSAPIIPINPQQLQNNGYSATTVTLVTAYDNHGALYSPFFNISAATIVQSSYVHWVATLPTNCSITITASIDHFSTFLPCTNNQAIPGLLPGMNLAGKYVIFVYVLNNTGNDPTLTPFLSSIAGNVEPAFPCTKTDSVTTYNGTTGWSAGTLTNLINTGNNHLQLNGYGRNYDDANYQNQTTFGSAYQFLSKKQLVLQCGASSEARTRLDFAGQWANFTAEVDLTVTTGVLVGFVYRTTNWSNTDSTWAYAVEINTTTVKLQRGSNSGSSGTSTQVGSTATVNITSGAMCHLKIVINGSSHMIYLNDTLVINATDGTFTAAGYLGFRNRNTIASTQNASFDNFGVVAALSGTWVSPVIDIHSVGTISNSQIILQTDPAVNYSLVSFLVEISLNNGTTWTTCPNTVATNTGYYQVLPVPGLSSGTNVSSYTQVLLRITISATTASLNYNSTETLIADVTAISLFLIGPYNSSGYRTNAPIGWDTMIRSNVSGNLGVATNGATYTQIGTGTLALSSNEAVLSNTTGDLYALFNGTSTTDQMCTLRFALQNSGMIFGATLRYTDTNNYYRVFFSTTTVTLCQILQGNYSILTTASVALSLNTFYQLRFAVQGSGPVNFYVRIWPDGTAEPSTWTIQATN